MARRRRDAAPRADDDAAVVDALIRQLRGTGRAPAPTALTTAAPAAALPSTVLDTAFRSPPTAPSTGPSLRVRRRAAVWGRVGLGVVVAVAVPQWPYDRTCGLELLVYLLAVATVFVTGFWGATAAWRGRVAAAHVVALCTILWSLVLAADEVVSRTDYVGVPVSWQCGSFRAPHPALPARLAPASRPPA